MAKAAEKKQEIKDEKLASKAGGAGSAAGDPSMEEILKSIRGVIAGEEESDDDILELTDMVEEVSPASDEAVKGSGEEANGAAEEKSLLDEIDDAIGKDEPEPADSAEDDMAAAMLAMDEAEPEPEEAKTEPVEEPEADPEPESEAEPVEEPMLEAEAPIKKIEMPAMGESTQGRLIKEPVADESAESLKSLVNAIPRQHVTSPYTAGGTTLEQLTIEAMRPFLAEWLNENLPVIVKQIVSKEIKKLIPEDEDK